jgi:ribosome maturation factor RimP
MEKQQIHSKIEEIVTALGFVLIDLTFRGDNHLRIVEVYIDSEKGIDTEDCAKASRAINESIELEDLIETSYRLDVSSPGVERPLKFLLQYKKHINRKFDVEYKVGEEIQNYVGKLIRIEDDDLFFAEKEGERKIKFENIVKAKVIISF